MAGASGKWAYGFCGFSFGSIFTCSLSSLLALPLGCQCLVHLQFSPSFFHVLVISCLSGPKRHLLCLTPCPGPLALWPLAGARVSPVSPVSLCSRSSCLAMFTHLYLLLLRLLAGFCCIFWACFGLCPLFVPSGTKTICLLPSFSYSCGQSQS